MSDHQPIQPEFHEKMNRLARVIDEVFNGDLRGDDRKVGFAVLLFKFGDVQDRRANYISNARREDMIATMKEFIARNEGRYVDAETKQ